MEGQGFRNKVFGGYAALGPGIITAALVFGPSKITITSKLGASYGHDMLWIVVLAIFFMVIFTNMGARIGLSSPLSLLTLIRNKWGKAIGISIGLGVFLVSTSFQAGNSIGVGLAVAEASHTPIWLWILVFNSLGIGLLFFKSFYKILEKLMIGLVGIMLFSFTLTLFMVKPSFEGVMSGFIPSIPDGSAGLMIAFMASCFSIVGAFYQAYLIQEKRKINIPQKNRSSSGILILGVMSAVVIICAATVLYPQGIQVSSASEMSIALEPLFGSNAAHLFLVGLFGASFSSLVGNATVGGSLLADALGFGHQLHLKRVKYCIALVMVAGASIALIFGNLPLELIIFAQRVTIFLVPIIGLSMFMIANDKGLMKERVNSTAIKFGGIAGIMLLVGLAIWNFGELFNN
ncbi:Nramp family divalent metal transporter [Rhodonellum sp.]|uniref:Nramp family divalent metal transporter n=1 Tax=Rhodonellum sp. TaxID=2231180 RepID=UPI00271F851E|nr:Nramp family divalent metal transporter [Rhodonellum sp.]MDO9552793.1 Nramp family divalent metal transporter [Rhodonellum sp.]